MNRRFNIGTACIFVSIAFLLQGCVTWHPKTFATPEQAFPPDENISLSNIPPDAYTKRTYKVNFADMFQIVDTSASQAGLDVQTTDPTKGVILATKSTGWHHLGVFRPHIIFTKVLLQEKSSRSTEVIIIFKDQGKCADEMFTSDCK